MEKKESVVKDVLKTMLKTLVITLALLVFVAMGVYVINPRFSAGVCEQLGWKHIEISCYELLYARNKDNADLYNLVVKIGNVKDYEKQNDYINKLQAVENYTEFCENMDNSVVENYNSQSIDAEKLSLLYGTNEYISSREVISLVEMQKYEEAYACILDTKVTDKTYELAVYNYVEYLYASKLSVEVKTNYFTKLKSDFTSYLESKDANLPTELTGANAILSAYTKLKIKYTKYIIALQTSPDEIADSYTDWQEAQNAYNSLI